MTIKKKRILFILLAAVMIAMSVAAGVSVAYLSGNLEKRSNTFVFNGVSIRLVEEQWDQLTDKDKILYPGKVFPKDPAILNTGDHSVYAYAEVIIPREAVKTVDDAEHVVNNTEPIDLLTYEADTSDWVLIKESVSSDKKNVTRLYGYQRELSPGETTEKLCEEMKFANILEGDLPMGTKITVPVNVYAIQSEAVDASGDTIKEKLKDAYSRYQQQLEVN